MTDSEITIKALKEILELMLCEGDLQRTSTISHAIDLIDRLQAENERLKGHQKDGFFNLLGNCLVFSKTLKDYNDMRKGLKAEAYKECIEKVKELFPKEDWFTREALDSLLKELVGDK